MPGSSQINVFTGKTAYQDIMDRLERKIALNRQEKPIKALRINEELKKIHFTHG